MGCCPVALLKLSLRVSAEQAATEFSGREWLEHFWPGCHAAAADFQARERPRDRSRGRRSQLFEVTALRVSTRTSHVPWSDSEWANGSFDPITVVVGLRVECKMEEASG